MLVGGGRCGWGFGRLGRLYSTWPATARDGMGWGDDDKDGMMGCGEVVDGKGRQTYRMRYELHLDLLFVLDRGPVMDDVNISPTTMMGRRLPTTSKGIPRLEEPIWVPGKGRGLGKEGTWPLEREVREQFALPSTSTSLQQQFIVTQRVAPERNKTTRHRILSHPISSSQDWWGTEPTSTRETPRAPRSRGFHHMPDQIDGKGAHHDERRGVHLGAAPRSQ